MKASTSTISASISKSIQVDNFIKRTTSSAKREAERSVKQLARQATPDQDWQKVTGRAVRDAKPVVHLAGVVAGNIAYKNAINKYEQFIEKNKIPLANTFSDAGVTFNKCSGKSFLEEQFSLTKDINKDEFGYIDKNGKPHDWSDAKVKAMVNEHGQAQEIVKSGKIYQKQMDGKKLAYFQSHYGEILNQTFTEKGIDLSKKGLKSWIQQDIVRRAARKQVEEDFYINHSQFDKTDIRKKDIKNGKKTINLGKQLTKKADTVEKWRHFTKGNLRRMPQALLGIAMTPIRNTDAGRGISIAQGMGMAGLPTTRMANKTGCWIGRKSFSTVVKKISYYKFIRQNKSKLLEKAFKNDKKAFKEAAKKHAQRTARNKFKNGSISEMFKAHKNAGRARKIAELNAKEMDAGLNAVQGLKRDILKGVLDAKGDKKAAFKAGKTAVKQAVKNTGNGAGARLGKTKVGGWVRQVMNKAARKLAGTKFGRTAGKVGKGFGRIGKFFAKIFQSVGGTITKFIAGAMGAFSAVIAFVMHIVIWLLGIVLLVWLLAQILTLVPNVKELFSNWKAGHDAKVLFQDEMNCLDIYHNTFVGKIQEEMNKYPAATVIFPDGQQENYRELLSAYDAMENNESNQYDDGTDNYTTVLHNLYDQTHYITTEEFTFSNPDGSTSSGVRIYVEIQRNESLTYSALAGKGTAIEGFTGNCPAGNVVNDDWIAVVKTVKQLLASTGTIYSQTTTVPIEVNGTTMNVRPDCSGMTSACLQVYGSLSATWSSTTFTSASELAGFTRYTFSGWDNLCQGDIISYNGHVEIFAYNADGKHYVWNAGSTSSVQNPGPTTDTRNCYITVWRPNSSVTSSGTDDTTTDSIDSSTDDGTTDTTYFKNLQFDWKPSFSNSPEFGENGNESGYAAMLTATVQNEIDSTASVFNDTNYDADYGNHAMLTDAVTKTSSYDFIRYVCAQHGVQLPATLYELMIENDYDGTESISYDKNRMKVGDIVFFQRIRANNGTMTYNALNKALLDAEASGKDTTTYQDYFNAYVPMIYIGNNQFAAYDKDLTLIASMGASLDSDTNKEFADSEAKVRLYTFDDSCLRYQRIMCAVRPTGYTKNAIYGAIGSFAGWTDDNIRKAYSMMAMDYWVTGEVTTIDLDSADLEETKKPFFSSWHEGSFSEFADGTFAMSGGVYYSDTYSYASMGVTNDMVTAIWETARDNYDNYQILPSVLIAEAVIKSNGRSTEEALRFNNIYELQVHEEVSFTEDVDKYYYNSPTSAQVDSVGYKKFDSIASAVKSHAKALQDAGGSNYDNYEQMIKDLTYKGIYSTGERDEIISYINTHPDLQAYDTLMTTRQSYVDSCGAQYISLDWNLYVHGSSTADYTFHDSDVTAIKDCIKSAQIALDTLSTYCTDNSLPVNDIETSLRALIAKAQAVVDDMNAHASIEEMPSDEGTVTTINIKNGNWTYKFVFNSATSVVTIKKVYKPSPTATFTYNSKGTYTSWTGSKGTVLNWTGVGQGDKEACNHQPVGTITSITTVSASK